MVPKSKNKKGTHPNVTKLKLNSKHEAPNSKQIQITNKTVLGIKPYSVRRNVVKPYSVRRNVEIDTMDA